MDARVRRLMIARLVSEVGTFAAIFVGIWGKATFRLHATPRQMAASAALGGLTAVAGGLLAGVLVDRHGPRKVLIGAEIFVVPIVLSLMIPESIWPFIAMSAVAACAGGFIMTAVASFAPYLSTGESLAKTNASIETAAALAMVFGPAVGGAIAKLFGIDGVFVFDAITSAIAVALLAPISLRAVERGERSTARAELKEGLRFASRNRAVRLYLISGAVIWFSFAAFGSLEALFYRDVLHSGPALIGWILSLFGGALLAGSLIMPRLPRRLVNARAAVALVAIIGVGEIVYVATDNLAVVIVGNPSGASRWEPSGRSCER